MTFRLLTCFSAILAVASAANLSGKIELTGSKEARVRTKKDFSGVVVWLENVNGKATPMAPPNRYVIDQRSKKFLPHLLVVPVGATVEFPNNDPIFHNAFSNFSGQAFDTGLYPPGTSQRIVFRRPGVVRIFCNIHSHMSAVLVVSPTPHFAVTGENGSFQMQGVAPGEYRLRVFHERATAANLQALERKITVTEGMPPLQLSLSEAGYLATPHKNKHGQEYPAVVNDKTYMGPR